MNEGMSLFKRVLITGCAGEIAIAVCRILRECNIADEIWGCDINPTGGCEYYFDKLLKVNRASSRNWFSDLRQIVLNNNIELIIPTVENELSELIRPEGVIKNMLMPSSGIIDICLDKYKTAQFLNENNIAVAKTDLLENSTFKDGALVIKPCSGRGSQDVRIVKTENEFIALKLSLPRDKWICQELLEPRNLEYTCGVFRSASGDIRTITFRRTLKNGMTGSGSVEENREIRNLLHRIANAFGLVGSINVQCILTKDGPKVFEINPRFSSTVRFRHLLGFNDVIWSILDHLCSELPPYSAPTVKTRFTRIYDEIVLKN